MAKSKHIEVFYDGDCPLCLREVRFLQKRNRKGLILFTDISDPAFDPSAYGKSQRDFMAKIHGRDGDGTWLAGVEVFRRLYRAAGFGWAVWLTRLPVISQLLGVGYWLFARNRLRLTGRQDCLDGACSVPPLEQTAPADT